MLVGLPLITKHDNNSFRRYVNNQLEQHIHVAAAEFPKWISSHEWNGIDGSADGALIISNGKEDINFGLFLLIVKPDSHATLMTLTGECCYHVGKVECDSSEGCVFLVHFSRGLSHAFMGGTLSILDVFAFDGINYSVEKYSERLKISRFMHRSVKLPSRFIVNSSRSILTEDAKNTLNYTLVMYVLLK